MLWFILLLFSSAASAQVVQDAEQVRINVTVNPPVIQTGQITEARCLELGLGASPNGASGCICSEPLQMTTWDNGIPVPTGTLVGVPGATHNPDDSPPSSQCKAIGPPGLDPRLIGNSLLDQEYANPPPPRPGFILADPSTEPVPPGHSLLRLFGRNAQQETWVQPYHSYIFKEAKNWTYCTRFHTRWGLDSPQPMYNNTGNSQQYKVQTLGCGWNNTQVYAGPLQTGVEQPGKCEGGTAPGTTCYDTAAHNTSCPGGGFCKSLGPITIRFDCMAFNAGGSGPGTGQGANWWECKSNYCRFEQCIDHNDQGFLRERVQITVLPVANAAAWPEAMPPKKYTWVHEWGRQWHPYMWPDAGDGGSIVHFYNGIRSTTVPPYPTRMASYAMAAKQRPMRPDFWIGKSVEFSGTAPENAIPVVTTGGPYIGIGNVFTPQATATDIDGPNPLTYFWDPSGDYIEPSGPTNECATWNSRTILNPTFTRRNFGEPDCVISFTVSDGYNQVRNILKVTWSPMIPGMEKRCSDLGARCVCSEQLNWAGPIPTATQSFNPGDSPSAQGKECDGEGGPSVNKAVTMASDWATAPPTFVRTVASGIPLPSERDLYVYKTKLGGAQHLEMDKMLGVSNETVCVRTYRKYDPGVARTSVSTQIKNLQLGGLNPLKSANVEHDSDGLRAAINVNDGTHALTGSKFYTNFQLRCTESWCRIEICADKTGTSLTYRYRIFHLKDGQTQNFTWGPGLSTTGATSTDFDINRADMFVQDPAASNLVGKFQYMTHTMEARVPHNPSFWIGEACEVEGGC